MLIVALCPRVEQAGYLVQSSKLRPGNVHVHDAGRCGNQPQPKSDRLQLILGKRFFPFGWIHFQSGTGSNIILVAPLEAVDCSTLSTCAQPLLDMASEIRCAHSCGQKTRSNMIPTQGGIMSTGHRQLQGQGRWQSGPHCPSRSPMVGTDANGATGFAAQALYTSALVVLNGLLHQFSIEKLYYSILYQFHVLYIYIYILHYIDSTTCSCCTI